MPVITGNYHSGDGMSENRFPNNMLALQQSSDLVVRRVADINNGFTRIANDLLEAIACAHLTARQLKVMLAYMRKTYGFNKKSDRISDEQIARLTGLSRQNVNKAKKELLAMNCLVMVAGEIGVNKEISAWQFSKYSQGNNLVSKSETQSVSDLENVAVSNIGTDKRHTKKDKKDNINLPAVISCGDEKIALKVFDALDVALPDCIPAEVWSRWVCYRKEIKHAIKSKQTVIQAINLLQRCHEKGHQPADIINNSIANGWSGLFEPRWTKTVSRQNNRPLRTVTERFRDKDYGHTQMPAWAQE